MFSSFKQVRWILLHFQFPLNWDRMIPSYSPASNGLAQAGQFEDNFDIFLFKVLLKFFVFFFTEFIISDETDFSLMFEFSQSSFFLIEGIQFTDTNLSGGIEDSSLILFGYSFDEVLFHLVVI